MSEIRRHLKVYMAGPLFTTAERMFNSALAEALRYRGHEVFLPQEIEQIDTTAQKIFAEEALRVTEWCDVVVANMDGPDPDSGTCWECGAAFKRAHVIAFRTDFREINDGFPPYNLMIAQSATASLDCRWKIVPEIAEMIDKAIQEL